MIAEGVSIITGLIGQSRVSLSLSQGIPLYEMFASTEGLCITNNTQSTFQLGTPGVPITHGAAANDIGLENRGEREVSDERREARGERREARVESREARGEWRTWSPATSHWPQASHQRAIGRCCCTPPPTPVSGPQSATACIMHNARSNA